MVGHGRQHRRMAAGMSTGIQWTDETWNPAVGCTHISPGCDHCYAATVASRQMQPAHVGLTVGRKWNDTVRLLPERLDEPLRWRKPRQVFVGSMTDLFHHDVPARFLVDVWATMALAQHHTFQVLTKRPNRAARILNDEGPVFFASEVDTRACERDHERSRQYEWAGGYVGYRLDLSQWLPNVWLGTSIESQRYVFRARQLADAPAAVRFLSVEPLIAPVDLTHVLDGIHWVIVGAESGPGRRECCVSWVRDIRDQCAAVDVPLFVKQLQAPEPSGRGVVLHNLDDFPTDLRIREWPA